MAQLRSIHVGLRQYKDGSGDRRPYYDPEVVTVSTKLKKGQLGRNWRKTVKVGPLLHILLESKNPQLEYDLDDVAKAAFDLGREFEAAEAKKRKK